MSASPVAAEPFAIAERAAAELVARMGARPEVALVLGSGWRPAADALGEADAECPVSELPGFVAPTVPGHQGAVRSVRVDGRQVVVLLGRSHFYESRSATQVVHAVRTAVIAGAGVVVLTNAAGAVNPVLRPGQVVLVRDHLNLTGTSPLAGGEPPPPYRGPFVDLTDLYASDLRRTAKAVDPSLAEGVYAALPGPTTKRRPRSPCCGPRAPTWSVCRPPSKRSPCATWAPWCSGCRW